VRLKGKGEPQTVHKLLSIKDEAVVETAAGENGFVGRRKEKENISQALSRVLEKKEERILVCGEPGVGKSRLKDELSLTYVFITHDLATARYICDRIAIMYLGRIVEVGSLQEVYRHPLHPYTEALLAAVPVPDPRYRRTTPMPRGEIPNPIDPPTGCRFHPRCPNAKAICSQEEPQLVHVTDGHQVACHLGS
ncbi:MAG: oligopeptide/dipeptide ABC transporter ATP-binding protein, partial [Anaerolineae bacterium]